MVTSEMEAVSKCNKSSSVCSFEPVRSFCLYILLVVSNLFPYALPLEIRLIAFLPAVSPLPIPLFRGFPVSL